MSHVRGMLIGILIAITAGCVGSVNPIVAEDAGTIDPQLLGTWSNAKSTERAVITQVGQRSYGIQYTDAQGQSVSLVGRLARNRDRFILDVQPTAEGLGPYKDFVVRLHIPVILDSIGPRVGVAILDPDSLDRYLRAHPGAIAHGRTRDGVVLTATSPALQRFLTTYLRRPGAVAAPDTWTRRER